MVKPSHVVGLVLQLGMALSSGYAAVGLTLLGVGGGIAAGTGVSCTLGSIADKTFTAPEEKLRAATLKTLKRMDLEVKENSPRSRGRKLVAVTGDRTIELEGLSCQ